MKTFRAIFCVLAIAMAGRAAAGEIPIEAPDRYSDFSFQVEYVDEPNRPGETQFHINLPARPNPSITPTQRLNLIQRGSSTALNTLGDRQAQTVLRALKTALADYVMAPPAKRPPGSPIPPAMVVRVNAGENSGHFTFVSDQPGQWKKATELWNTIRSTLQPSQQSSVPAL